MIVQSSCSKWVITWRCPNALRSVAELPLGVIEIAISVFKAAAKRVSVLIEGLCSPDSIRLGTLPFTGCAWNIRSLKRIIKGHNIFAIASLGSVRVLTGIIIS